MTILPGTYMPVRPAEYRVTILDTDAAIADYETWGGLVADDNGEVILRRGRLGRPMSVPLRGLYRLQSIENGIVESGAGRLLTEAEFRAGLTEFAEPYFEYGVKCLPRRSDVVVHGSLDAARAALDDLPALKASGEYGIVRRLTSEPGDWELVPE
jgi:hypothetical protein